MPKLTEWLMQPRPAAEPQPQPQPTKPRGRRSAWYKIDGATVHVDGRNLPAPCVRCHGISELLCDFPFEDGSSCSAPICSDCAKEIAPDTHLCPLHVRVVQNRKGSLL